MSDYCIKNGDTLYKIAKTNNISVDTLKAANPSIKSDKICLGQTLVIPDTKQKTTYDQNKQTKETPQQYYTIKKGNTFESISQEKFIPLEDLKQANSKINPAKLRIGQQIAIPQKRALISSVDPNDKNFNNAYTKILRAEGGFKSAEKDGSDVRTNKGITQDTYNHYLKDKAFDQSKKTAEKKDVKNITDKEVKEIYYNYYYKKSGANTVKNPKTSHWMMDTAVNCGTETAKKMYKQCGTDNTKWYNTRKEYYENIVKNNPKKSKFLAGWLNRIKNLV